MVWGPWRSCRAWWWGGGAKFGEEGGQAACGEDGLGWRLVADKDGLGRRRGGHGEDGQGAAT
jgi:hypothetical protein